MEIESGIWEHLARIEGDAGHLPPPRPLEERRWFTEQRHSVWKMPPPSGDDNLRLVDRTERTRDSYSCLQVESGESTSCRPTFAWWRLRREQLCDARLDHLGNRPTDRSAGRKRELPESSGYRDPMLSQESMKFFWDAYVEGQLDTGDSLAVPMRRVAFAGLPPAYPVIGEFDPLRDETIEYADRLRDERNGLMSVFRPSC